MSYCDTNILTSFLSKDRLRKNFGLNGINRYKRISRFSSKSSEDSLKKLNGCVINRKALFEDIGGHEASMGATLTSIGLKDIKLTDVDGLEEGKKIYNDSCSISKEDSKFYKKFCKDKRLKIDLSENNLNDIRHFGTAIKLREQTFITDNKKDFIPLTKFTEMGVI